MQTIKAFLNIIWEAFFSRNGPADDDYLELMGPEQISSNEVPSDPEEGETVAKKPAKTGDDEATARLIAGGFDTPVHMAGTEH